MDGAVCNFSVNISAPAKKEQHFPPHDKTLPADHSAGSAAKASKRAFLLFSGKSG